MELTRRSFVAASSLAALCAAAGMSVSFAHAADASASNDKDSAKAKDTKSSAATDELAEFPITIDHAYGSTTIESAPERVVCLAWNNMEPPLALGIAPVGYSKPNYGYVDPDTQTWPWVADAYKELGAEDPVLFDDSDGFDFEAINDCKPDIILAAYSGVTEDDYEALTKIAPTVVFPEVAWQTFWREQTLTEGTALGMAAQAQELIDKTDELIAKKVKEYGTAGHKGAIIMTGGDDLSIFYIYLPIDPRGAYLIDLGIELPESVTTLAESDVEKDFALTLSSEQADQFNDIEIAVIYGDDALLKQLQEDPLLGAMPCIAKGAVAMLPADSPPCRCLQPLGFGYPCHH